jgi:iron uptake system component EfeO
VSIPVSRPLAAAALALSLAGTLAACGGSSSSGSTAAAPSSSTDAHTAAVTISAAKGCSPNRTSFAAGPLNVNITNTDATAVSEVELLGDGERIIGEKENLPPGFSGSFAVSVPAGTYSLYCPGAAVEKTALTVTGTAAQNADTSTTGLLAEGSKEYAAYVNTQMGYLVSTSQTLAKALKGTNLTAAQDAYMKARPYYEKIEPVAESFTVGKDNLDANIDARAGDVPASQWTGFHPIEQGLFQKKSLKGLSGLGDGLVANVTKLQGLTAKLTYQPFELANGAQELLDEVSSSKITGEEERYSHIDLLDFQGNMEGAQQAFADLLPGLKQIDPALATEITTNFASLQTLLDKYRTGSNDSGFELYGKLTTDDKKSLAAAVKNVQEPLSTVAAKVAH